MPDSMTSKGGGGGGGTPGGSSGQIEYNNSGAFGGFTMSGDVTVNTGTGVAALKNTGPGVTSATNSSVTIDAQGRVTALSSGAGGGSASPFAPAGFANVSTFSSWTDLAISPDGAYVYVCGVLSSNSHGAIAKVKIADGTVAATIDLGATVVPQGVAVLPDSAHLYAYDKTAGLTGWYVTTATMVVARTDTLTPAVATTSAQQFDLSPDGAIYAYVSGIAADEKVYKVATATGVETSVTVGHSDGGSAGASSVCWYNGSSANFYVAYNGVASVDLYSAGVYTSTVATGAGGTPAFNAMRSGINGSFFIADSGTNTSIIAVASGSPTIYPTLGAPQAIATNYLTDVAISDQEDICTLELSHARFYAVDNQGDFTSLPTNTTLVSDFGSEGASGLAILPDVSSRFAFISGSNYPTVWFLPSLFTAPRTLTAGNIQTSDGLGNWVSKAPYFTSADQTITAAGALTIAHGLGYTPGSVWFALVNQSAEAGYTSGQVVFIGGSQTTSVVAVQNDGYSAIVDGTNLTIRYGSDASTFTIPHATTGAATAITDNKWNCRFFAR